MIVVMLAGSLGMAAIQRSATETYRGEPVQNVRFAYEGETLPEASRALVEIAPGDPYEPEAIRRSIHQLFALGVFSDIKVEAERIPGGVDVTFRLYPRMTVRGVRLELPAEVAALRDRLLEAGRVRPGDPLDVESLAQSAERIRSALQDEGYLWASVEPEASFQSPTAVVVFHVAAGARARLSSLRIVGVAPHVETDIRRGLKLTAGSVYSRAELEARTDAVTARWKKLGFYDATIAVTETLDAPSRVALEITPRIGPKVIVDPRGFDLSDKELRELIPIFQEARVTPDLVEESRANLEQYLLDRGYRDATVTVERESGADGHYLVIGFAIVPGTAYEVARIELEGLTSLPKEEVRAVMRTRTHRFVRSAPFRRDQWQDDLREVRRYLRSKGFHAVQVEGRERPSELSPSEIVLVATVREGPRATVDAIQVDGAQKIEAARVLSSARIAIGDPFDASKAADARDRVTTLYRTEGFRQAEVGVRNSLDPSGQKAFVSFVVSEGEQTRVDRVIVTGLEVTRDSTVAKLIKLDTDAPLSSIGLLETRQELVGSGLFRDVGIDVLPPDPESHRSDILISLEEGPRTTFAYGFGYEERQLARAEVELTRRNLFGLNRTVSVFTRASLRGGRFITTYRQPELFSADIPVFVSAFAEKEERPSFDFDRIGVGLQLSKRVAQDQNFFLRYRFDRTNVFNLAADTDVNTLPPEFRDSVLISAVSAASLVDRRDDPLNPRSGQFRILDVEWSARALGTEAPYLKGLAQQFFYVSLPNDLVGAVAFRVGVGQPLRGNDGTLLPPVERFFAGGATTLRGFGLDEASPKAKKVEGGKVVDGLPIGGNVLTLLNMELRFPIRGNLRGVVFSDNGTVYPSLDLIKNLDWRYNVGFGFRYETPLGPLRVDYGLKLDRRTVRSIECPDVSVPCREPLGTWHISLGHAF